MIYTNKKYRYQLFNGQMIYAITDYKSMKNYFKKTRNMDYFIIKKISINGSENMCNFESENSDKFLIYREFNINGKKIDICITKFEDMNITHVGHAITLRQIYELTILNPNIFSLKIQKLLDYIRYNNIYDVWNNNYKEQERYPIFQKSIPYNIYGDEDDLIIEPNYINIFLHYYGNTIKL